jgi:hypothetical protein
MIFTDDAALCSVIHLLIRIIPSRQLSFCNKNSFCLHNSLLHFDVELHLFARYAWGFAWKTVTSYVRSKDAIFAINRRREGEGGGTCEWAQRCYSNGNKQHGRRIKNKIAAC